MPIPTKHIVIIGLLAVASFATVAAITRSTAPGAVAASAEAGPELVPLANSAVTAQPPVTARGLASGKKLLFFMNPNGYPCQTQLGILNGVADSLSKVAQVVYVKTTEPADMQKFEDYGIRGLPSLVITDRDGREISRFAPGIQRADAVLAALTK